jgi:RNA polymerase sigma-70 factor (ECF subfamily)
MKNPQTQYLTISRGFEMASRKDIEEFSLLMQTHLDCIIRYISFLMRGNEEAKDIAQEAFFKAWQKFDPSMKKTFRIWIMKIARNMVIDRLRRKRPNIVSVGVLFEHIFSNSTNNDCFSKFENEFCPEGLPAFAKLPVDLREIVFMRYVEQIPYKEMSSLTGKSEAALRKIVSRALIAVRKEVAHESL